MRTGDVGSRRSHTERRVFRVLAVLALLAVGLSLGLNWLLSPARTYVAASVGTLDQRAGVAIKLDTPSIDLLPETIIGFETIARQPVPGQGDLAGEAIYATLSMNLEASVPIGVYARIEGFGSAEDADQRARQMLEPYTLRAEDVLAGGATLARGGFASDEGAYAVAWARNEYAVFVKVAFKDKVPAQKRDFLRVQSRTVVDGVDVYQRTGKQGVSFGGGPAASPQDSPEGGAADLAPVGPGN